MPSSAGRAGRKPGGDPDEALKAVERFLASSRQPALLEPGEDPFPLTRDGFAIEHRGGRLTLHVWDHRRNLVRRVVGVEQEKPGRLELRIERFGGKSGTILLFDRARPDSVSTDRRGRRLVLRELFRRSLSRQYPGWTIRELSTEPDLEHTLSPVFPRALLGKGGSGWAAMAAPADASSASCSLTFGLIWLDYLRRRERRLTIEGLALFLPEGHERTTCLRLQCLNPRAARFAIFLCAEDGHEQPADPRDHGNLDTRLETCRSSADLTPAVEEWVGRLCRNPHVEQVAPGDGSLSLRVRGLEFARAAGGCLHFGLAERRPVSDASVPEVEALAAELARLRSPQARDRANPLCQRQPEAWLESQVRAHIQAIDAGLRPSPVYGQVPAFAGGERSVIDLLAAERTGRLAVVELKASADPNLPLQALDYWMRVRWHAERGDFSARGFFPGLPLALAPPRLLLLAPALEFHPTTETVLRYFSPEIEVERIGLGMDWREELRPVFRLRGAERPG